ncbi:MAG: hypothetical protein HYT93_00515 [Parcubacteria group bacterium]|nr:hypothetical protein [Parcubacteria group bacterium]
MSLKRLGLNSILLVSILFLPWWATIIIGIALVLVQKNFYEIIAWAIFYDLLYNVSGIDIWGFTFFFTLGALILFYSAEFLKSKTRFS